MLIHLNIVIINLLVCFKNNESIYFPKTKLVRRAVLLYIFAVKCSTTERYSRVLHFFLLIPLMSGLTEDSWILIGASAFNLLQCIVLITFHEKSSLT